jgi:hypothetical protein
VGFATTNGEMIAGLEPARSSMAAIDWLVSVGAVPTVCVFRPVQGTAYAGLPPPDPREVLPVFQHLYRRCMEAGLPIGVAPNVRVSIVLTPEECVGLLPPGERRRWPARRFAWAVLRRVAAASVRCDVRRARRGKPVGVRAFLRRGRSRGPAEPR